MVIDDILIRTRWTRWRAPPDTTVQVLDLAGRVALESTMTGMTVSIDRSPLIRGVDYQLWVRAGAELPGGWTAGCSVFARLVAALRTSNVLSVAGSSGCASACRPGCPSCSTSWPCR